ncbi:Polysaccharide deacetylase [compost metagenome]
MFNHTANHPDLTTIDVATIKPELDVCRSWMNANGFSKASDIVAYPYGSFNDNVLAAMKSYRLGMSTQEDLELSPPISPLTVKTLVINNDTQNSVYENAINTAVQTGSTVILLLHRIEDSGTDAMVYHTDKFISLVDYIASKDVDVVSLTEWLS